MLENDNGDQEVLPPDSSNKERSEKRIWGQSNKTTRILTPLVILFAVTMFPLNALRVLLLIMPGFWTKSFYNLIIGQLIMFIMINSSANPLVYYITSKEFKDAFREMLKRTSEKKWSWKPLRNRKRQSSTISRTTVV